MKAIALILAVMLVAADIAHADEPKSGRFQIVHDLKFVFWHDGKPDNGEYNFAIFDTWTGDVYACEKRSERPVTTCLLTFRVDNPRDEPSK